MSELRRPVRQRCSSLLCVPMEWICGGCGYVDMDMWIWICGYGYADMDMWMRDWPASQQSKHAWRVRHAHHFGYVDMWICGYGYMDMDMDMCGHVDMRDCGEEIAKCDERMRRLHLACICPHRGHFRRI